MLLPPVSEQDHHWKSTNLIITFVEEYLPSLMTAVSVLVLVISFREIKVPFV